MNYEALDRAREACDKALEQARKHHGGSRPSDCLCLDCWQLMKWESIVEVELKNHWERYGLLY